MTYATLFCFFISICLNAQVSVKDSSIFTPMAGFSYAYQVPGGDVAKSYGNNSNVGVNFYIKTKKNRLFGADCNFLFGNKVKNTTRLDHLRTSAGFIITENGDTAQVYLYERGYAFYAKAGKVISFKKPNPNSGLILTTGIGFLQHKMRIEVIGNNVPELTREYRKGYDRLSNGFAITQFAGYQYLGNNRLINFFGGFEVVAAFTKNRRGYNFDTMEYDNESKIDLLYGIRLGWVLPLYKKVPREFYFH